MIPGIILFVVSGLISCGLAKHHLYAPGRNYSRGFPASNGQVPVPEVTSYTSLFMKEILVLTKFSAASRNALQFAL